MEKLPCIADYPLDNFESAIDVDLKKWALHAQQILGFEDTRFKVLDWWVRRFERNHYITSRNFKKLITKKTLEDKETFKVIAKNFVNKVKPHIS